MSPTPLETCLDTLKAEGWVRELSVSGIPPWYKVGYRGAGHHFQFHVAESDDWLLAQSAVGIRCEPGCADAVWRYLLELNHQLRLVKFTLSEIGEIFIAAEQPAVPGDCAFLKRVLTALRLCSERYHREIELLARDPALAEAFRSLRQAGQSGSQGGAADGIRILSHSASRG